MRRASLTLHQHFYTPEVKMDGTRDNQTLIILQGRQGQSLVLALMILFMLVFIGGLFVTLVVKNMGRTARSGQTMSAEYLAETGVRYASDQLTYSLDGADWRPVPNYPGVIKWLNSGPPQVGVLDPVDCPSPGDPDYDWLMKGFCRFTYANGRFLIKVSYSPRSGDPVSKYIKIESVGRVGVVDESDPTTLQLRQPVRMRSEKVAYKAIGITDYSRFITNLDHRTEPFALGMPVYTLPNGTPKPFVTQYGESIDIDGNGKPDGNYNHGGSIRVNGNLTWYGMNYLWLDRDLNESVEVAGDITHAIQWDYKGAKPPADATAVYINPDDYAPGQLVRFMTRQSSDPLFNTSPDMTDVDVGVYRDGRPEPDVDVAGTPPKPFGRPRGIQRLDPPLIDINGPAGGAGRYRELTRNSGEWVAGPNGWFNTGYYGWGKGVYINNKEDIQSESELRTLRDDWMNPGGSQYWAGPYYTPPGVVIILTPYDLDNGRTKEDPHPDMIIVQTNISGAKFNWYDRDGNILTPAAGQLIVPYPENGVIFAEGNIRIKGTLAPHQQLTVVSGGTIYVEGNILKANLEYQDLQDYMKNILVPLDWNAPRDSGISLLANDNVCVNTTQFFGPAPESQTSGCWRPDISSYAASVDHPLTFNFAFGEDPTIWYKDLENQQIPVGVYIRHTADNGPSYMTMAINQTGAGANPVAPNDVSFGLYQFGLAPWCAPIPARSYIYPLADPEAMMSFDQSGIDYTLQSHILAEQKYPMWEHQVFPLLPLQLQGNSFEQNYALNIFPGANNLVTLGLDQNMARSDYLMSRLAIQPCDIRIEALMYAQTGSFYVIPGEWFNPDPSDTRENVERELSARVPPRARIDLSWPYFGDPLDVKVTIYGAVSENVPAPIADEAAWMDKWGWIPPMHGESQSTRNITASYRSQLDPRDPEDEHKQHGINLIRQRGLSIIYDNQLSYPKVPNADTTKVNDRTYDVPIRRDAYLRPLPITPKLPVSAQTLFFGSPT